MTEATRKLRADYSARKTLLEQERQAFFEKANSRITDLKRQLDEAVEQTNATLAAKTAHIAEVDDFLKWVDSLETVQTATETNATLDAKPEKDTPPPAETENG